MKKTLFICFLFAGLTLQAQDFTTSQNTFLSLSANPESALLDKLDSYEPKTSREKEQYKKNKAYFSALATEMAIGLVYQELETQKGIKLADKDALRDFIPYGNDGLPIVIIPKSAAKKMKKKGHETDYYFHFSVATGVSLVMKGLPGQLKPQVTCTIKVFDGDGKVIKKVEEKVKTKTAIKLKDFPKRKFDKLDKGYISMLTQKLKPQITKAVIAAVKQL